MPDFNYIAFDAKSGAALAHGHNTLEVRQRADDHFAAFDEEYDNLLAVTVLYCGEVGRYIWWEKLNLRRATFLIDSLITTTAAESTAPAAQLDELRA